MLKKVKRVTGFTLLEVLLSIAIIGILAGISMPIYQSFQVKNDLDVAVNTIVQTLRRAQLLSQAVDGDSSWGVYMQNGSITLFQGADYSSHDSNFDEVFDVPTSITFSGIQEIVFTKFSGEPQTTGIITLNSSTNETRTITINEKGMVSY